MADDIVTRLRMPVCGLYDDETGEVIPCPSCVEAADEIEQVRTQRDAWRNSAIEIASWEVQGNPEGFATEFYKEWMGKLNG